MSVVVVIVVIVAIIVGAVLAQRMNQKRIAALVQWASAGNWAWSPRRESSPQHSFSLFNQGHSRFSKNHLTKAGIYPTPGLGAASARLFEYHYAVTTSNGKTMQENHYWFRCALIEQEADLGQVQIRDENFADKLVQSIGFDDIDLEDPEFSKRFVVNAKDRKDAYDLIGAGMMQAMLQHYGWHIETNGRSLLIHRTGRLSASMCQEMCDVSAAMLAQLPRTLVNATRASQGLAPTLEAGAASAQSRKNVSAT